jgi:hypothetical protein
MTVRQGLSRREGRLSVFLRLNVEIIAAQCVLSLWYAGLGTIRLFSNLTNQMSANSK